MSDLHFGVARHTPYPRNDKPTLQIQPIQTHKITTADETLTTLLDQYLHDFAAGSILVITSKIVSLIQKRVVAAAHANRQQLIEAEAEHYLPPRYSRYQVTLTIKAGLLIPNSGVDESNAGENLVLWPADPQAVANEIRAYLCGRFGITEAGVLITDSRPLPLRWGVTGVGMAHSGFHAINDLIGQPDIFGRPLAMTKVNVMDGLAAAAVLVMGEGAEQTPLAVVRAAPFVHFQPRDPTAAELAALRIAPADDLYAPLLTAVTWVAGA